MTDKEEGLQYQIGCLITELASTMMPFIDLIPEDAPDDDMATKVTLLLCSLSNALQDFYDKLDEKKK